MTLELHATPEEVMRAVEALQEFGQARQVPDKAIFGLALALEECGSNIVNHALRARRAADLPRDPRTHRQRDGHRAARSRPGVRSDAGARPEKEAEDDDRPPGGWGIQLVRRYTDEMRYTREGEENILRLTKRLVRQPAANGFAMEQETNDN